MRSALLSLPVLVLLAMPAAAAPGRDQPALREALSLKKMFRNDVTSMGDRRIGRLRDVLINDQGEITTAVVEFDEGTGNSGFAIALLEWSEVALEPADDVITVSIGSDDQAGAAFSTDGIPARDIIGRAIALSDEAEFGAIDDVLVDPRTRQPVALVVAADGERYALPFPEGVIGEDEIIRYGMSREDLEAHGAFKSDAN